MTNKNKAREALDKWKTKTSFDKLRQMGLNADDYLTIRRALTILERLEGVDRVALREDIEAVHLWINDLTADFPYDCVESINEAARLYAAQTSATPVDLIDPLAGTPDGLVG